jgi:hypothetical protein
LQSACFRPHNKSEELEDLYLVGAGTHPGAGVPAVLASGKNCCQFNRRWLEKVIIMSKLYELGFGVTENEFQDKSLKSKETYQNGYKAH